MTTRLCETAIGHLFSDCLVEVPQYLHAGLLRSFLVLFNNGVKTLSQFPVHAVSVLLVVMADDSSLQEDLSCGGVGSRVGLVQCCGNPSRLISALYDSTAAITDLLFSIRIIESYADSILTLPSRMA